jgi:hypothetical protein
MFAPPLPMMAPAFCTNDIQVHVGIYEEHRLTLLCSRMRTSTLGPSPLVFFRGTSEHGSSSRQRFTPVVGDEEP